MRNTIISLVFVLGGLGLGYLLGLALGVSGGPRVIFGVFGILIAGAVAKALGLAPASSRLK